MTWVGLLRWAVGSPDAEDALREAATLAATEAGSLGVLKPEVAQTTDLSALCHALDAHAVKVPGHLASEVKLRKTPTCAAIRARFGDRG